jgi:hypothetical protein
MAVVGGWSREVVSVGGERRNPNPLIPCKNPRLLDVLHREGVTIYRLT